MGGLPYAVWPTSRIEQVDGAGKSCLSCNKSPMVLTNLPEEQHSDYGALSENRFGSILYQVKLNRIRLCSTMKRREESLPELAEDVEQLTRLAHPDAAEQMMAVQAKDQGLSSNQARLSAHYSPKWRTPLPKEKLEGVVYQIPCQCSKVYVGETQRPLETWVKEHRDAWKSAITSGTSNIKCIGTKPGC